MGKKMTQYTKIWMDCYNVLIESILCVSLLCNCRKLSRSVCVFYLIVMYILWKSVWLFPCYCSVLAQEKYDLTENTNKITLERPYLWILLSAS